MNQNQIKNLNANLAKPYTTHMGVLTKIIMASEGDVIECGGGPFSTPLLHWLCKMMNRDLITYENDKDYFDFEHTFQSRQHRIRFIENWDDMDAKKHRGVVFIDHHPNERRGVDVLRFKDSADFIVMHDTEKAEKYGYDKVWEHFKYVYHWKDCRPWTSVVSNFKDLSFL